MNGVIRGEDGVARCAWGDSTPEYRQYHDREWGFPVADDVRLFEKLCLEGFQAGLSWLTILRKREAFRRAFEGFDFAKVARFTDKDLDRLMADAAIVRGVDIKTLAQLMGHQSTRMTEHYLHLAGEREHLGESMRRATSRRRGA